MLLFEPMSIKYYPVLVFSNTFVFLLVQAADFFRDDNLEGIEARNEVSTLY